MKKFLIGIIIVLSLSSVSYAVNLIPEIKITNFYHGTWLVAGKTIYYTLITQNDIPIYLIEHNGNNTTIMPLSKINKQYLLDNNSYNTRMYQILTKSRITKTNKTYKLNIYLNYNSAQITPSITTKHETPLFEIHLKK